MPMFYLLTWEKLNLVACLFIFERKKFKVGSNQSKWNFFTVKAKSYLKIFSKSFSILKPALQKLIILNRNIDLKKF